MKEWYGVDFDGTLATYDGFKGAGVLGEPIPLMVERVKRWLAEGREVRIVTARVWHPDITARVSEKEYNERMLEAREARRAINAWCLEHIGQVLPITCEKDYGMVFLYDDRAKQVYKNIGVLVEDENKRLSEERYRIQDEFAAYIGEVTCPCGKPMKYNPRPSVADPAHIALYSCTGCSSGLTSFPTRKNSAVFTT